MYTRPEESNKNQQISHYDGYNAFRTTALGFRKSQKNQNISPHLLTTFRSHKLKRSSKKLIIMNNNSPTNIDLSCSKFMKNYIDKLKKQRKRQNKKHQSFRNKKIQNSNNAEELPLCKENDSRKIILLDKVNTDNTKNVMNTISIVSKDLYQVTPYGQSKTRKVSTPLQNPSWAKKQRLHEIISGVRKISSKQLLTDHILQGRAQFIQSDLAKRMLVQHRKQKKERKNFISDWKVQSKKKKKLQGIHNFKVLQPWKQSQHQHHYTIQEYQKQ